MAISREDTLRREVVIALQEIAVRLLGFDVQAEPNIKDYPLEGERDEAITSYLMTDIGGRKELRAIAVNVMAKDEWLDATGRLQQREYTVEVTQYYGVGTKGEGWKLVIDHARYIRQAIKDMNRNLNGLVDYVNSVAELSIEKESGIGPSIGEMLVGKQGWTAIKQNPDF